MFEQIFDDFVNELRKGQHSFLQFDQIKIDEIAKFSNNLRKQYSFIAIIGVGASSLNIRAICSSVAKSDKKTIYLDSIDDVDIEEKLELIDVKQTIFFVLSKSGNTEETYLLTKYLIEEKNINNHDIYIITNNNSNLLFNFAKYHQIPFIEHEQHISGRFSIISSATLIPCSIIGVDIKAIIESASKVLSGNINNKENIIQIAKHYLHNYFLGKRTLVTFNYCHQLDGLCRWQQQLIGESLGKNNFGITPILSRGTFDEHSQLQLYLEGPDDKFFEIIAHDRKSAISQNLTVHANNIYKSIIAKGRTVLLQNFEHINEAVIVNKIIESIFVTILIAKHQKINPFNQTAVDNCKVKI